MKVETIDKYYIEYGDVEYPCVEVMVSEGADGITDSYVVTLADIGLWSAMEDDYNNGVKKAVTIDNRIYYYCDSGVIEKCSDFGEIIKNV